jgi:DNA repair protein RecO (recombination protein O)
MRQRLYRTPAVVLKRMDLGEADRIVTLYTRDHGKLRAVAKGVRKSTSRSAGHLELFTLADLLLAVGRELDVVSQAETIRAFRKVRENVVLTTHAYYLAELADVLTEDRMDNRAVFDALVEGFSALGGHTDAALVVIAFQLRLLHALGYRPELRECVTCRAIIQPGPNRFTAAGGGVVCPACSPREPSATLVSVPALKLLRHLQHTPAPSLVVPGAVAREAESILREYTEQLVERRLRSPALIARVQEAGRQSELYSWPA